MELSIYHNGQFFVGLIEFKQGNKSKFVQHIFGKEPDDLEILNYIYNHLLNHLDDTETTILTKKKKVKINPKRLQREVAKEQKQPKDITYAQLALKKEQELNKRKSKKNNKLQRDLTKKRKRKIKQIKAKEKHKGH
ncbi:MULTISPECIES: YjdF family protein [Staphylococcus]|uniref:YjdF family protein n=1 Tax=Staphylococcus TaxID=1279 RepID=UPI0002EB8CB1|nr:MULTISPECIES: YjdF family protein [Staphylococcus]MBM6506313.1 YjdF family protein [Staphylococcus pasteuri]PTU87766.1 DUF2992 domain-containing protein [Staphylococcus pasteuri]QQT19622.1 YjdF family protein [Staphylococcus pasteuri]VXC94773.1 conserved hypothetical protein [Staphylococcus sp. 8AQ]